MIEVIGEKDELKKLIYCKPFNYTTKEKYYQIHHAIIHGFYFFLSVINNYNIFLVTIFKLTIIIYTVYILGTVLKFFF